MFGSDWPVCRLAAEYPQVKGIIEPFLATLSDTERAAIEGDNARDFYGLGVGE